MSTENPWLIAQLQRLAANRPDRFQDFAAKLQSQFPEFYEELALSAISDGQLSIESCAIALGTDPDSLSDQLEIYRSGLNQGDPPVLIEIGENHVARLRETGVKVWEIVYKFRSLGSIEALQEAYTALTQGELKAALRYAERHPEEIEARITEYLKYSNRTHDAYPYR